MKSAEKHYYQKYIGDLDGFFLKKYRFCEGKADGVRAIDVRNGRGIELTVLPDRCLDIPYLYYKGTPIAFCSKTGIVSPAYFVENSDRGFLRSFNGGFLTTCGLTYMGAACNVNNEAFGMHGLIGNIPASQVSSEINDSKSDITIDIEGKIRQTKAFDENLVLNRKIICMTESNKIFISNHIINEGFVKQPLMVLYHFNFGYPMLSKYTKLYFSTDKVLPRDNAAKNGLDRYNTIEEPEPQYNEQVFYHSSAKSKKEEFVLVYNEKICLAVLLKYNPKVCPWLLEWKNLCAGDYALGLEPANCHVSGRATARKNGDLQYILPNEKICFDFEIEILDELAAINNIIDMVI